MSCIDVAADLDSKMGFVQNRSSKPFVWNRSSKPVLRPCVRDTMNLNLSQDRIARLERLVEGRQLLMFLPPYPQTPSLANRSYKIRTAHNINQNGMKGIGSQKH